MQVLKITHRHAIYKQAAATCLVLRPLVKLRWTAICILAILYSDYCSTSLKNVTWVTFQGNQKYPHLVESRSWINYRISTTYSQIWNNVPYFIYSCKTEQNLNWKLLQLHTIKCSLHYFTSLEPRGRDLSISHQEKQKQEKKKNKYSWTII